MRCPRCLSDTQVVDSRPADGGDQVRRRRRCVSKKCGHRFSTYESHEEPIKEEAPKPRTGSPMRSKRQEVDEILPDEDDNYLPEG